MEGNEIAKPLTKQVIKQKSIQIQVPLNKCEIKPIIEKYMARVLAFTGDWKTSLQNTKNVGVGRKTRWKMKDKNVITPLRTGNSRSQLQFI